MTSLRIKIENARSFFGFKLKGSLKWHLENRDYFMRIKNQITAALIKLKKTAALPISLARFASL
jgi:hypothetical protein